MSQPAVPTGFAPHYRPSPITAPWEPIYSKHTDTAVLLGLRVDTPHTNSRGLAHGALITALADNAMGLSCGLELDNASRLVTVNLGVDFISSARIGQWLQVETQVIRTGGTLCFAQCAVTADGQICARGNGTFRALRPKPG